MANGGEQKLEKEMEENIWKRKVFGLQMSRKTEEKNIGKM